MPSPALRPLLTLPLLLSACGDSAPSSEETPTTQEEPSEAPAVESGAADSADSAGADSTPQLEDARAPDGSLLFREDLIHALRLTIPSDSWDALLADPRSYAPATLRWEERDYEIAIRAKGNTQFRTIDDKPSLVLDFNRVVKGQTLDGLPSVYLHNMTYDPSMMHEHLAYGYFRSLGVPASRTAYAQLTVNDEPYGLFLFVEKQNRVYREQWWTDSSGSLFETGSFNHGCDLNDLDGEVICDCFETDDVGSEEDPQAVLAALCTATSSSSETWYEDIQQQVHMPTFLLAQAAEMVISHYDNYGWNKNNWRIYHEPSEERWYFTPWSTDLSFGWHPWSSDPHCGHYGQSLTEYQTGYLLQRCWGDSGCREDLKSAMADAAVGLDRYELPRRVELTHQLISEAVQADGRRWYDDGWYQQEVECNRSWAEGRAQSVLDQIAGL